jgi:hypothetical protein
MANTALKVVAGLAVVGVIVVVAMSTSAASGGNKDCGRLVLTPEITARIKAKVQAMLQHMDGSSRASTVYRNLFRIAFPSCPFDDDTEVTVVIGDTEIHWPTLVTQLGSMTMLEASAQVDVPVPGKEGAIDTYKHDSLTGPIRMALSHIEIAFQAQRRIERILEKGLEVAVPYLPAGRQWSDTTHYVKWGGTRMALTNTHKWSNKPQVDGSRWSTWAYQLFLDDAQTKPLTEMRPVTVRADNEYPGAPATYNEIYEDDEAAVILHARIVDDDCMGDRALAQGWNCGGG